ncbi:MAG: carbohydrate kinase [Clostridiales Family XIII bacterium]|jgi:sugar/nucleoside kinase (ribokinase family)|nr:carbohydrate kinase [Clostridiales Family XIII bacterium]
MAQMTDIVALGESLIDFVATPSADGSNIRMDGCVGGAPLNALAAAAKLGRSVAYITKVGRDVFGDNIKKRMKDSGIDLRGVVSTGDALTTLAIVSLSDAGERSFAFYRDGTADILLRESDIDKDLISQCRIFHFGSVSLTSDPARETTLRAASFARSAGVKISFDPNYRAFLWKKEADARRLIREGLALADYVKINEDEARLLTGTEEPEEAASLLMSRYDFDFLAITSGAKGSSGFTKSAKQTVPSYDVKVVDTTGAGDAFWGAALHKLLLFEDANTSLGDAALYSLLSYAGAAGALTTTARGALTAQATDFEILQFMADSSRTNGNGRGTRHVPRDI